MKSLAEEGLAKSLAEEGFVKSLAEEGFVKSLAEEEGGGTGVIIISDYMATWTASIHLTPLYLTIGHIFQRNIYTVYFIL